MRPRVVRLALLAYPRRWRRRYGFELEQLTLVVLTRPQNNTKKLGVLLDLVAHGFDERVRRTESTGAKAALTSMTAWLAGMFVLAGGVASDSAYGPNVQISASVHLGAGVALVHTERAKAAPANRPGQLDVLVPNIPDPQVFVRGARSAVVINTRSGQVVSVTHAAR